MLNCLHTVLALTLSVASKHAVSSSQLKNLFEQPGMCKFQSRFTIQESLYMYRNKTPLREKGSLQPYLLSFPRKGILCAI